MKKAPLIPQNPSLKRALQNAERWFDANMNVRKTLQTPLALYTNYLNLLEQCPAMLQSYAETYHQERAALKHALAQKRFVRIGYGFASTLLLLTGFFALAEMPAPVVASAFGLAGIFFTPMISLQVWRMSNSRSGRLPLRPPRALAELFKSFDLKLNSQLDELEKRHGWQIYHALAPTPPAAQNMPNPARPALTDIRLKNFFSTMEKKSQDNQQFTLGVPLPPAPDKPLILRPPARQRG